jgi:hypothetical protein
MSESQIPGPAELTGGVTNFVARLPEMPTMRPVMMVRATV